MQNSNLIPFFQQQRSIPLHQQELPPRFLIRPHLQCSYCNYVGHVRQTCWKLNPHLKPTRQDYRSKAKTATVQLVQEPDFYGVVGQDHHTTGRAIPTASFASRGKIGMALKVSNFVGSDTWIIDSGASDHMTYDKTYFTELSSPPVSYVTNANGEAFPVLGTGSIRITPTLQLHNVLYVTDLSHHLISVPQLNTESQCSITFYPMYVIFQDLLTRELIGRGYLRGRLFHLDQTYAGEKPGAQSRTALTSNSDKLSEVWLWHRRLGHPSFSLMKKYMPTLFIGVNESVLRCETCVLAKSHRATYPPSFSNKSVIPFELIHSDVWGPSREPTVSGMRYFVLFIDDCTRLSWVALLRTKDEVFPAFQTFRTLVQTQYNSTIRVLRSDNGGEYVNHFFKDFFQTHGIVHQTTCPQTPEQNGVSERKNRHLLDMARAILFSAHMPKYLWGDAVQASSHLINRLPSSVLQGKIPFEVLASHVSLPSFHNLPARVFGCVAFVHVPKNQRSKLDARAIKCVFVGYGGYQKGYKCYHPPTRKYYVTMDVTFFEDMSYFSSSDTVLQGENSYFEDLYHFEGEELERGEEVTQAGDISASLVDIPYPSNPEVVEAEAPSIQAPVSITENESEDTTVPSVVAPTPEPQLPGIEVHSSEVCSPTDTNSSESNVGQYVLPNRSTRGQPPKRYEPTVHAKSKYPVANYMSTRRLSKSYASFVNQISAVSVPNKVQDALGDPKWRKAMEEEMEALQKNDTWQLVPPPQDKKAVGCRWVFTVKHNADGSVNRYKARLVAKGFTQTYGIDYDETFAPVAKMNTIRVLLSCAANLNWPLRQFDVKNAFLYGELAEEVYMSLPPGYVTASPGDFVCKLRKSLYGLKQSPRAWFGRFTQFMRKFGYRQSHSDHTLFLKHQQGNVTALIIYVDDMVITGNDTMEMDILQRQLASEFEMKDLGELKYFLGIEVARGREGIYLCQRKYILDLLTETGMLDCKPIDTPIEQNHCLAEYPDQVSTDRARYQRLVGRLIYLAHTRPDVAYAVSVVSQFMHNPSESHMDAVVRILRYLKSAPGRGVMFSKHNNILEVCGFTDADWAGNITDRRSTSGYFTFVGGNLVTWKSKKQKVVARSSAEAEYRGMAHGVCELLWLRNLLHDLGFKLRSTMQLYCDNRAAIDISQNPVQHDRTKHVEVDRHFIKEKLDAKLVSFPFVPTEEQLADILTKGISRNAFYDSLSKLGMVDVYAPT
ncbi:putative RNA-directed DNA polymerase [Rosa chinensis]|uniref:Putative RNA-directed DNA polymerase n=1 Tax=Rosa chinensis TaxID=74649 RepID=A0A2P6P6K9_ROSCH|nr:putative RNA-directed DNA polymerase [Rosa chinensis]